jgi:hypothetical protein
MRRPFRRRARALALRILSDVQREASDVSVVARGRIEQYLGKVSIARFGSDGPVTANHSIRNCVPRYVGKQPGCSAAWDVPLQKERPTRIVARGAARRWLTVFAAFIVLAPM